jgi:RNA polymerase sigma-70 factor (ECF subfamily)
MGFHTTHWTVVVAASAGDGTKMREALSNLCVTYWYPLYAFIRRRGSSPHDAEDLTQEFFCRFLERNGLASVRPEAGKFRSFLLACLKNFLANERERLGAPRGGGSRLLPLDAGDAEARYQLEPPTSRHRSHLRKALARLLERTMAELRKEYSADPKRQRFQELEDSFPVAARAVPGRNWQPDAG